MEFFPAASSVLSKILAVAILASVLLLWLAFTLWSIYKTVGKGKYSRYVNFGFRFNQKGFCMFCNKSGQLEQKGELITYRCDDCRIKWQQNTDDSPK